jgi:hypothetical protein
MSDRRDMYIDDTTRKRICGRPFIQRNYLAKNTKFSVFVRQIFEKDIIDDLADILQCIHQSMILIWRIAGRFAEIRYSLTMVDLVGIAFFQEVGMDIRWRTMTLK